MATRGDRPNKDPGATKPTRIKGVGKQKIQRFQEYRNIDPLDYYDETDYIALAQKDYVPDSKYKHLLDSEYAVGLDMDLQKKSYQSKSEKIASEKKRIARDRKIKAQQEEKESKYYY